MPAIEKCIKSDEISTLIFRTYEVNLNIHYKHDYCLDVILNSNNWGNLNT